MGASAAKSGGPGSRAPSPAENAGLGPSGFDPIARPPPDANGRAGRFVISIFGVLRHTSHVERDKRLEIRLAPEECAAIAKRASDGGITVSDYVRRAALGAPIKIQSFNRLDPADLAQIKRLGSLLNQIAHAMHKGEARDSTFLVIPELLAQTNKLVRRLIVQATKQ